jgi:hypothetical protein
MRTAPSYHILRTYGLLFVNKWFEHPISLMTSFPNSREHVSNLASITGFMHALNLKEYMSLYYQFLNDSPYL